MERFIYEGGYGVCVSRCSKEELAWAIDKWFQFTISYNTILLESSKEATYRLAINNFYANNFSYLNTFEINRDLNNWGCTVHNHSFITWDIMVVIELLFP